MYLSRTSKVEIIQGNLVAARATLGSRISRDPRARIARDGASQGTVQHARCTTFNFYVGNLAARVHSWCG